MKWSIRARCVIVCLGFTALFSLFSFRLVYIQMIKHDEYAALAAEKHVHKQNIQAERGTIVDANGDVLATNVPVRTVVADATRLNDLDAAVDVVSSTLKIPAAEVREKLQTDRRYIVIKREVSESIVNLLKEKLRARNPRAFDFEPDATRVYPNGPMLCHVIGFTDFDHKGIQGIEASR